MAEPVKAPVPPFNLESATKKVKAAEDAWNTCDPKRVALAYSPGSAHRLLLHLGLPLKIPLVSIFGPGHGRSPCTCFRFSDSKWRNRDEFFEGREAIESFLTKKWQKELQYKLMKELWCYQDNRISVRFEYEYHDHDGQWWRAHGNEVGLSTQQCPGRGIWCCIFSMHMDLFKQCGACC